MLLIYLLHYLKGYVILHVHGYFQERFINLVTKKGITVWGINRKGKSTITLCMSVKDFKKIRKEAKKSLVKIKIKRKKGLPFIFHKYRKRYGIMTGVLAFLVFIFIMSGFIWSIDVTGNDKMSKEQIVKKLNDCGFKIGVLTMGCNLDEIKNDALDKMPELSWLTINIKGSKAVVEVKERVIPPNLVPSDKPCNIIALREGIITNVQAYYGNPMVKIGDAVEKGSLLISGVLDSTAIGMRLIHADGKVFAMTHYVLTGECPLNYVEKVPTGKIFLQRTLQIFNISVKLYIGDSVPFKDYEKTVTENELSIGDNIYMPLKIITSRYSERQEIANALTEEEAKKRALELILAKEKELIANKTITNKNISYKNENDIIKATAEYEVNEDIATAVEIQQEK